MALMSLLPGMDIFFLKKIWGTDKGGAFVR
jgi:hypothetical protein